MIDTHCHLTFPDFEGRIPQVLEAARAAGVTGAMTVSTTPPDAERALGVAMRHNNVWCSAGVHPLYADQGPFDWTLLRAVAFHDRCAALGELGLDNHYSDPPRTIQRSVLEEQLAHIQTWRDAGLEKPVILHCRDAFADLVPVLRKTSIPPHRFVFHCFTGNETDMRLVLDFGASVSFTGVVTYQNAREVQAAARLVPLDRIMVETDAPFLTPHPHRGVRPNEPRFARVTAEFLAQLRGESWNTFHGAINDNTRRFFGIQPPESAGVTTRS